MPPKHAPPEQTVNETVRTRRTQRLKHLAATAFTAFAAAAAIGWSRTPNLEKVRQIALGSDRILLASDGTLIQTLRTDFNKRRLAWTPLKDFPQSLQKSVISAEDQRFYSHFGFDIWGLGRAFSANIRGLHVQGASTLTMQLSDLIQEDVLMKNHTIQKGSFLHKIVQVVRACLIETKWTKSEILEAYLNLIHLKGEFQGVPATVQGFLHRSPQALDSSESAVLATMISSPNQNRVLLKKRACLLARKIDGSLNDCAQTDVAAEEFFAQPGAIPSSFGSAPHLARRLFAEHPNDPIVHSTIDASLQRDVVAILDKNIARLKADNVNDSAAIVIDNRTGQVVAYVGAVSTSESPHVDGIMSYRQAGSSLKPFLYGKAIDLRSLTAASILLDEPTAISWGSDVYRPSNYDKHFYGPVSVREALGSSLNVPAVKTVVILGLHQAYQVLQSIHLSNLKDPDFYGASLALGAVEVRLDELANGYRIFANGGVWNPLQFVESQIPAPKPERIYSPETAFIVGNILSDPNARAIGFGWESPLETPFWTAVKTGTSKDYRDNWCVGYSEHYTVAVWAGNFDAQAMYKVSGVSGVGPSWYEIMLRLHENKKSLAPPMPPGIVAKEIRHSWASHTHRDYFIKGTEPVGEVVEPVLTKFAQFVFPAEGSVLVRDPHMDQNNIALFIRFSGTVPEKSRLILDGKDIGEAVSPFKLSQFGTGVHRLEIENDGKSVTHVKFFVKGAGNSSI